MLDFIRDDNHNITDSNDWGNYSDNGNNITRTGSSDSYSAKNIYDVAGNVIEWIMETDSSKYRVYQGGCCVNAGTTNPASDCGYTWAYNCISNCRFQGYSLYKIKFEIVLD